MIGVTRARSLVVPWAGLTDTNQAAAETAVGTPASTRYFTLDLNGYTEYRVFGFVGVIGHTTAVIGIQYSADGGSTLKYLDDTASGSGPGSSPAQFALSSTGTKQGSWAPLAAGARTTVIVRAVSYGGNGAADPVYSYGVEFR